MQKRPAKLRREFPKLSGCPRCPHAMPIAGVTPAMQGVVCRVMEADQQDDPGLRMTAAALGTLRETKGGVYLNLAGDPSSVTGFCYGNALGRSTDDDAGPRAHFTFCPVWEEWDERRRAGKSGLTDYEEPETVAMGIDPDEDGFVPSHTLDAADPWSQARRDLDELAPLG